MAQIDGKLLIGIQHTLNADWLTPVMKGLSFLGNIGWASIVLCMVLICIKKTRKIGFLCAGSVVLTFVCCTGVIKPLVDRMRPWEVINGVNVLLEDPGDASFPSGHAANSMAVAFALWLNTGSERGEFVNRLHRWSWCAIAIALLIGLSRLYLGMHFPSDVLAGILLAIICGLIVYRIDTKLELKNAIIKRNY